MKRREVQRHVVAQVLQHPIAELLEFGIVVVQRRDDEVGDLKPHARLMTQPAQRVEHRLQVRQRDFGVELLGEGLQVDVGSVDVGVDVEKGFTRDVAVGHHYSVDAGCVRIARDVDDVFAPYRRLVVGECNVRSAMLDRKVHLFLFVKVREGWSEDPERYREMGLEFPKD